MRATVTLSLLIELYKKRHHSDTEFISGLENRFRDSGSVDEGSMDRSKVAHDQSITGRSDPTVVVSNGLVIETNCCVRGVADDNGKSTETGITLRHMVIETD